MQKVYCVYDNFNNEQLVLVADTVQEVADFVGARKIYVLQTIIRGSTINKKRYTIKRIYI